MERINIPNALLVLNETLDKGGAAREALKHLGRMVASLAERVEALENAESEM